MELTENITIYYYIWTYALLCKLVSSVKVGLPEKSTPGLFFLVLPPPWVYSLASDWIPRSLLNSERLSHYSSKNMHHTECLFLLLGRTDDPKWRQMNYVKFGGLQKLRAWYVDGWLSIEDEVMQRYIGDFSFDVFGVNYI